ncbi:MAG: beta-N-acetylhexosaminidase [Methylococcaceae bacterium]|nr:beta-N-acetylhexosaminidase [Methylococcaceae bacterium]
MTSNFSIGPVLLDVEGLTLAEHEKEKINHPNTGAVILFARNYEATEQLVALIKSIRAARQGQILIAVDQEGGRVQRFKNGFTRLPPASCYAEFPEIAESAGWLMASELLDIGVDFSFAPVLDVDCGVSDVIGDRSFSGDYSLVARLASDFRKGMNSAGMAATGKHFPGHGYVALDSHLALPVDEREFDDIWLKDLVPFKQLIHEGLEAIMPAHVVYSKCDVSPAGFSSFWIQHVLRNKLNFNGAVFSDDLSMAGAASAGDYSERAKLAQQAGCDMLLVCNNPIAAEQVLEALPVTQNPLRDQRLGRMIGKPQWIGKQLIKSEKWRHCNTIISQINKRYA